MIYKTENSKISISDVKKIMEIILRLNLVLKITIILMKLI